jgi:hypothetical protein
MDHQDFCLMRTLMRESRVEAAGPRTRRGYDATDEKTLKWAVKRDLPDGARASIVHEVENITC